MMTPARTMLLAVIAALLAAPDAGAQVLNDEPPEAIRGMEVSNRVGDPVPLDIQLYDADGNAMVIGDYFSDNRPILLLMVYYDCPLLCGLMLNKMNDVINATEPDVGEDYKIVVVSFDHTNTQAMAASKQTLHHAGYQRGLDELGRESYRFHTTTAGEARRLADAVGFDYRFMPDAGEFSHPSVMYLLTPDGRVASYLSGLDYEASQLRLAILDAGDGKLDMSIAEFFLHFCFTFDPTAGAFTIQAFRVMQIAGVLSILGVVGLVGGLRVWEVARNRSLRRLAVTEGQNTSQNAGDPDRFPKGIRPEASS